ncbi:hypothetical protein SMICM17S_04436 [Streptomyces microflavus]
MMRPDAPHDSLSGAAAWLGVGAAAAATGHAMPWPVLVVGALICAGAALAPDLDHKSATISRAFGPLSKGLCEIADKLSYAVYKATKSKADPRRTGGHRTLTHTWFFAVLMGAGCSFAASRAGADRSSRSSRPPGARRRGPALAGRPGLQRRPRLAPRRHQRLDPRGLWTSQATARDGSSTPPPGTRGSACPSCSAPWSTTSGTR